MNREELRMVCEQSLWAYKQILRIGAEPPQEAKEIKVMVTATLALLDALPHLEALRRWFDQRVNPTGPEPDTDVLDVLIKATCDS